MKNVTHGYRKTPCSNRESVICNIDSHSVPENTHVGGQAGAFVHKSPVVPWFNPELLSIINHEIRTPMNGIIGMADLMLDTPLTQEQYEFTGIMRSSALSLRAIAGDILDFFWIEAGRMKIEITDFSPALVIEGVTVSLAAKAHEKKLVMTTFIDPKLPALLRGDPMRLRQILLNLVGNAIKFTEHGEVSVRAKIADDGWKVRFEVQDTGIGLSQETSFRLFLPFTQSDSSTTRKYGGIGLGLSICKRLVELMDGEIGVDSEVGKGSTFWFTLPLIPSPCVVSDNCAAATSVVNLDCLHELFGDDPQLISDLIDIFRSSVAALLSKLLAAVERQDSDAVIRLARDAKDSYGNLGVQALADIAADIENATASREWEAILGMCRKFDTAFQQAIGTVWEKRPR